MKRLRLALLALGTLVSIGLISALPTQHASADGASGCVNSSTGVDECVILVVNLSGSNIPSSGITVTATRKTQPSGVKDNQFNLVKNSNTVYTSKNGVDSIRAGYYGGGFCADTSSNGVSESSFNISVKQNGKQIGSTSTNLCTNTSGPNDAWEFTKTVSIPVTPAGQTATKGGIKGTAAYKDPLDNSTGSCSTASFVDIYGGPDSIAPKDEVQLTISSGGAFTTDANSLKPGNGYVIDITCYKSADPSSGGAYIANKTNVSVTAGKYTTVNFTDIAPASAGGTHADDSTGGGTDDNDNDPVDCGAKKFNWVICSGVELMKGVITGLNTWLNSLLTTDTNQIFGTDCSKTNAADNCSTTSAGYKKAWNIFRVLAIAVIVIAGLIMVVSQAMGVAILDAYTIRKTLPRLIIAIIAISISWPLMEFVLNFFNTLGSSVFNLMTTPFNSLDNQHTGTMIFFANPLSLAIFGTVAWIAAGPVVLTLFLTAFIGLLTAFMTLVIRQAAIIVFVILAPLAIACYVLPNTQKVWKMWYDNFWSLLIMYPMVMAFIAAGRILSAAAGANNGGPWYGVVALVAYFLPYFMLPTIFKMANGVMGSIVGAVQKQGDKPLGALRGLRQASRKGRMANFKRGQLYSEDGRFGRLVGSRLNRGGSSLGAFETAIGQGGRQGSLRRRMRVARENLDKINQANTAKSEEAQAIASIPEVQSAMLEGKDAAGRKAALRRRAQNLDGSWNTAKGWDEKRFNETVDQMEFVAGGLGDRAQEAAFIGKIGTKKAYDKDDGTGVDLNAYVSDLLQASTRADGTIDRSKLQRLAFSGRAEAEKAGDNVIGAMSTGDVFKMAMGRVDAAGKSTGAAVTPDEISEYILNAANGNDGVKKLATGNKSTAVHAAKVHADRINELRNQIVSGSLTDPAAIARATEEIGKQTAHLESLRDSASFGGATENAAEFAKTLADNNLEGVFKTDKDGNVTMDSAAFLKGVKPGSKLASSTEEAMSAAYKQNRSSGGMPMGH